MRRKNHPDVSFWGRNEKKNSGTFLKSFFSPETGKNRGNESDKSGFDSGNDKNGDKESDCSAQMAQMANYGPNGPMALNFTS